MGEVVALAGGIIAGGAVLVLLFKLLFGDAEDFWDCVRLALTPDIISLFRGEWGEDFWAEMKLGVWLLCGGGTGYAVYWGVYDLLS